MFHEKNNIAVVRHDDGEKMITGILYLNYPFKVSYLSLFLSILACQPQYDEEISVEMTGYNVKCNSMVAHGLECVVVCSLVI